MSRCYCVRPPYITAIVNQKNLGRRISSNLMMTPRIPQPTPCQEFARRSAQATPMPALPFHILFANTLAERRAFPH